MICIFLKLQFVANTFSLLGSDSFQNGPMFYCRCFLFTSPRYLRNQLADRGEILHDGY